MEPAVVVAGAVASVALFPLLLDAVAGLGRRILAAGPPSIVGRAAAVAAFTAALISSPIPRPLAGRAEVPPPLIRLDSSARPPVQRAPSALDTPRYVVTPGDSLWSIACRLLSQGERKPSGREIDAYWRQIYELNRAVIGENPNLIHPGQAFQLPER